VAARALGRIGNAAAAGPLLESLGGNRPIPPLIVAFAVSQLRGDTESALIEAMRHPDWFVRVTVVQIIGITEAVKAQDVLIDALRTDTSPDVRAQAAWALGKLGVPSGLSPLLAAINPEEQIMVRVMAIHALGTLGSAKAVPALRSLLYSPSYILAHNAARALLQFGPAGRSALLTAAEEEASVLPGSENLDSHSMAYLHAREALAWEDLERQRRSMDDDDSISAEPVPLVGVRAIGG
jgi:HEAT repeat protein